MQTRYICLFQDESLNSRRGGNTTVWDSGIGGLSSTSHMVTQLEGQSGKFHVSPHIQMYLSLHLSTATLPTICRQRQRLSGARQPFAQRRRRPARGRALLHLGVLLRDLQRVSVRPAGRPAQPAAEEEGDAAAQRRQARQPLRER